MGDRERDRETCVCGQEEDCFVFVCFFLSLCFNIVPRWFRIWGGYGQ